MKKIVLAILTAVFVFSLSGCETITTTRRYHPTYRGHYHGHRYCRVNHSVVVHTTPITRYRTPIRVITPNRHRSTPLRRYHINRPPRTHHVPRVQRFPSPPTHRPRVQQTPSRSVDRPRVEHHRPGRSPRVISPGTRSRTRSPRR
jgi:hypothetical protein